eukprot:scaffold319056_cov21-Tisochrysis_lutea.AAC.1
MSPFPCIQEDSLKVCCKKGPLAPVACGMPKRILKDGAGCLLRLFWGYHPASRVVMAFPSAAPCMTLVKGAKKIVDKILLYNLLNRIK